MLHSPGFISTKMVSFKKGVGVAKPKSVSLGALNDLGNTDSTFGVFIHDLTSWYIGLLSF